MPVNSIFTIQQVQWTIPGVQTLHLVQLLLAHQADPTHKYKQQLIININIYQLILCFAFGDGLR